MKTNDKNYKEILSQWLILASQIKKSTKTATTLSKDKVQIVFFFLPLLFLFFFTAQNTIKAQETKRVYKVAIDEEYEPYEFMNDNNKADGFTPSLLQEIGNAAGITFEFIPMTWPDAVEALENSNVDIVNMIYDQERATLYDFSEPHSKITQALFRNIKAGIIKGLSSLSDHTIGFQKNDISLTNFTNRTDIKKLTYDSKLNGLLNLNFGEVDAFFCAEQAGIRIISKYDFNKVEFVAGSLFPQQFAFATRKGNRQLIELLNTHLAKLKSSGKLQALNDKWLSGKMITPGWLEKNQSLLFSVGGMLIVSLILLLLWNRSLRLRVLDRTKTLQASEENLSITLHSIGDSVISTDANGNVQRMNPVAEKFCGWTFAEAQGKPLTEIFNIINVETRKPVDNPVKLVMETGAIVGLANHTVLISKEGSEYQIADSAAPIKNKEGKIVGIILVFSDVTEKYAAQQALKTQLNELQQWYANTLGREERIIEMKKEVNELLQQLGKPKRYQST